MARTMSVRYNIPTSEYDPDEFLVAPDFAMISGSEWLVRFDYVWDTAIGSWVDSSGNPVDLNDELSASVTHLSGVSFFGEHDDEPA